MSLAGHRIEAPSPHTTGLGDGASEAVTRLKGCPPPPGRDGPANMRIWHGFLEPFESRRLGRDLHSHRPRPWPPLEPHRPLTRVRPRRGGHGSSRSSWSFLSPRVFLARRRSAGLARLGRGSRSSRAVAAACPSFGVATPRGRWWTGCRPAASHPVNPLNTTSPASNGEVSQQPGGRGSGPLWGLTGGRGAWRPHHRSPRGRTGAGRGPPSGPGRARVRGPPALL